MKFQLGTASKRTRGKTLCAEIHARQLGDREEITLNEEGQPIGPNERIVSQFTSFLGTIARSADLCPLMHTNWKDIPEKDKHIWSFVTVITYLVECVCVCALVYSNEVHLSN